MSTNGACATVTYLLLLPYVAREYQYSESLIRVPTAFIPDGSGPVSRSGGRRRPLGKWAVYVM